jgi:hypothetical protein
VSPRFGSSLVTVEMVNVVMGVEVSGHASSVLRFFASHLRIASSLLSLCLLASFLHW